MGIWSLYISFQNHNIWGGTNKFKYKHAILDENSFISNMINREATKFPSTLYSTVVTLLHMLLLTKTKGSCLHVFLMTPWLVLFVSVRLYKYSNTSHAIIRRMWLYAYIPGVKFCLLDKRTCIKCIVCELKKPMPSDS